MNTTTHIPYSTLADIAEGRAAPDYPTALHLAACAVCAADLAWLARTIELMRTDAAELPPPHVTARAKRLLRQLARPAGQRQRLLAHLQFDSARAPLAFGMRSAAAGPRQLVFDAGDYTIDLRFRPAGDQLSLQGQVLGVSALGSAQLSGAGASHAAELSSTSSFAMPPVQPGSYTLTIALETVDITIPDLQLA